MKKIVFFIFIVVCAARMDIYPQQQVTLNEVSDNGKDYALLSMNVKIYPYNYEYIKKIGNDIEKAPVVYRIIKTDEVIYYYTFYFLQDGLFGVANMRVRLFSSDDPVEDSDYSSDEIIGIDEYGEYIEKKFLAIIDSEKALEAFTQAYKDINSLF
jgi:hypothetical protein